MLYLWLNANMSKGLKDAKVCKPRMVDGCKVVIISQNMPMVRFIAMTLT